MSEARHRQQQEAWSEVRNFAVLIGFMLGVILFVIFSRPFIFERVVPAFFGDFLAELPRQVIEKPIIHQAPALQPVESEPDVEAAPVDDSPGVQDELDTQDEVEAADSGAPIETDAADTESDALNTATPSSSPREYTIRTGDNLSEIARDHSVTVRALMQANNLTDPDLIRVGSVLLIPEIAQQP